jgi:AbrB family looped-hinge helix DNA binding protein
MRITAKGQVTIPREVRERAGLIPGADVEFEIEAGAVRLIKTTRDLDQRSKLRLAYSKCSNRKRRNR